jgi:hypothetical protein
MARMNEPNKKLQSGLQHLVTEDSQEPISVLIELALPEVKVESKKLARQGVEIRIPSHVIPWSEEDLNASEQVYNEAKELLKEQLGTVPRWLEAAGVFVAMATPRQLRRIAKSSAIKAIWPNRDLRVHALSE